MKKILIITLLVLLSGKVNSQETSNSLSAEELAKQLANPVAALISLPLQNNFNFNTGTNNGFQYNLNVQPVVPISISTKWNMISRSIVPVFFQNDAPETGDSRAGLGDIVQSLFFSPKAATDGGIVWGVGPVLLIPSATSDIFAGNKWATGPNAVILKIKGPWTYGGLANHMWSFAGNGNSINATFFQPFVTYASASGSSLTIASENIQSWNNDIFGGFIGMYYAKVLKLGKQLAQFGGGPKVYYGNNPSNPQWGIRANIILLYPK